MEWKAELQRARNDIIESQDRLTVLSEQLTGTKVSDMCHGRFREEYSSSVIAILQTVGALLSIQYRVFIGNAWYVCNLKLHENKTFTKHLNHLQNA